MKITFHFRRNLVAGIAAILPLTLTIFIIWFLVERIGGLIGHFFINVPYLNMAPPVVHSILGLIAIVLIIYFVGLFTSGFIGRSIVRWFNRMMENLPLVKGLYSAAKKLTDTIFLDRTAFKKVVLIPYPHENSKAVAFLTNDKPWVINGENYVNVFIPTVPNPTSGFYLLVPEKSVIYTDMSVDSGFRVVISGGILLPEERIFNDWILQKKAD